MMTPWRPNFAARRQEPAAIGRWMSRLATVPEGAVLVTWVSFGHDPYQRTRAGSPDLVLAADGRPIDGPLLSALTDESSPLFRQVTRVYLCFRDAPAEAGRLSERQVAKETGRELRRVMSPLPIEVREQPWATTASPTEHRAILNFAREVLQKVRAENPNATIVVHTSPGTAAMHAVWMVLGSTGFLDGPVTLIQGVPPHARARGAAPVEQVDFDIDSYLKRFRSSRPMTHELQDDGRLWDPARLRSPAMREALGTLERWAPLRVPVLLAGERGVGKTTIANWLRARGPFQALGDKPWPVVVCGQFRSSPELARAELFGHARGAFTGALQARAGLLEEAAEDCLFLDEIADIDPHTQRLLIAVLEGRPFRRIGDRETRTSRFRLICATNRPLAELPLDPDFLDRIGHFTLRVPALRECREDLPLFWKQALRQAAALAEAPYAGELEGDDELVHALLAHPLPGNLRDLQRAAYHLLANLGDGVSAARRAAIRSLPAATAEPLLPTVAECAARLPLTTDVRALVDSYRGRWVEAAMQRSQATVTTAARELGVPRKTLAGWIAEGGVVGGEDGE